MAVHVGGGEGWLGCVEKGRQLLGWGRIITVNCQNFRCMSCMMNSSSSGSSSSNKYNNNSSSNNTHNNNANNSSSSNNNAASEIELQFLTHESRTAAKSADEGAPKKLQNYRYLLINTNLNTKFLQLLQYFSLSKAFALLSQTADERLERDK